MAIVQPQAERFVKLTDFSTGLPVWLCTSSVQKISTEIAQNTGSRILLYGSVVHFVIVKESPETILALIKAAV